MNLKHRATFAVLFLLMAVPAVAFVGDMIKPFFESQRDKDIAEISEGIVRIENEQMFWSQADNDEKIAIKALGNAQERKRGAEQAANGIRARIDVIIKRNGFDCATIPRAKEMGVCDFQTAE